ncbi:MAG: Gldg family protein [Deltaproteobacteria bacterium]|nr:Gldg family protein [Deltaproteobacteria bacterium]
MKVLQHLKAPVKVTGFFATGEDKGVKSLLERYDAAAPPDMFGFEIIDPDQHPEVLQKYDVNRRGAIVVETGGRNTIIVEQTEQGLTQAILKITQAKTGPVCFVTGHGEASINDAEEGGASLFKRLLENENHDTQEIVLAGRGIPEECSVAVLAGPDRPMAENEVRVVEDWVDRGGSLLYLAEPTASAGLEDWLAQRGVTLDDVIIVEPVNNPFFGSQLGVTPVVMDYPAHDITKDMTQPTLFSLARSLTLNYSVDTAMVSPILNTTDQAWGEVDVKPLLEDQVVERDEKDGKGPLVLGAALEVHSQHTPPADPDEPEGEDAPATPASARVVVIGDSTFLRNGLVTQLYNSDFALNVVAWLAGKEETISIRPNQFESSMILLTGDDRAQVFFISVLAVPMFVTMFGIGVILSRSRRSNA